MINLELILKQTSQSSSQKEKKVIHDGSNVKKKKKIETNFMNATLSNIL